MSWKKSGKFQCYFIAHIEVTIILLSPFRVSGRIWLITYKDRIEWIENYLLFYFTQIVRHCIGSGNDRNYTRNQVYTFIRILFSLSRWIWDTTKPRLWCKFCFSPGVRICATEFVYIVQYGYILSTVSIKYVMNFLLFTGLAAVSVFFFFVTSINIFE